MARGYDRGEVRRVMEECKNVFRTELIRRPRKKQGQNGGHRKFVLCIKWDPRAFNVKEGLKLREEVLYYNTENVKVFPRGSIMATWHTVAHCYMAPGQHGFRSLRSTLTQLLTHYEEILEDLNSGQPCGVDTV